MGGLDSGFNPFEESQPSWRTPEQLRAQRRAGSEKLKPPEYLVEKDVALVESKLQRDAIASGIFVKEFNKFSAEQKGLVFDFFGLPRNFKGPYLQLAVLTDAFQRSIGMTSFDGIIGPITFSKIQDVAGKYMTFKAFKEKFGGQTGESGFDIRKVFSLFAGDTPPVSRTAHPQVKRDTRPEREFGIDISSLGFEAPVGVDAQRMEMLVKSQYRNLHVVQVGKTKKYIEREPVLRGVDRSYPPDAPQLMSSVTKDLRGFAQKIETEPKYEELRKMLEGIQSAFRLGLLRVMSNVLSKGLEPTSNMMFVINRVDVGASAIWLPSEKKFIYSGEGGTKFPKKYGNRAHSNATPLGTSQITRIRLMEDQNDVSAFYPYKDGVFRPDHPIKGLNGTKRGLDGNPRNVNSLTGEQPVRYSLSDVMDNTNNGTRDINFHGGRASIGCTSFCDPKFMRRVGIEALINFSKRQPVFEENALGES